MLLVWNSTVVSYNPHTSPSLHALLQFCTITITDTTCEEGYIFSVDGQNCTGKPDTSCVHKAPVVKCFFFLVVLYSHPYAIVHTMCKSTKVHKTEKRKE